ncbi:MAG: SPOR domain-containing protein [Prevotellaceae bacterium]|jgi:nucleoid DNA-binding protein|nr:SPOR domain-containing protein [Prevotellaceae bacterium]
MFFSANNRTFAAVMKLFFQHIETLLIRNDYVIVPDFGGFVVQGQSSEIHDNTIVAPLSVVGFNLLLQQSDGLLEIEIARTQGLTYREAAENIERNVLRINSLLAQGKIIEAGRLGTVSRSNDKIIFCPSADFSFLPSNFGLQNIDFHLINANKKSEKSITVTLYHKTLLRYAASIALIISMLFAQPFFDNTTQHASLLSLLKNIEPQFETVKYPQYHQVNDKEKSHPTEISISNKDEATEPAPKIEATESDKNCHIIAGCFATEQAAQKYSSYLKMRGIDNVAVIRSAKLFRVSAGSFPSVKDAKAALKNLKTSSKEFERAWIMQKNI